MNKWVRGDDCDESPSSSMVNFTRAVMATIPEHAMRINMDLKYFFDTNKGMMMKKKSVSRSVEHCSTMATSGPDIGRPIAFLRDAAS